MDDDAFPEVSALEALMESYSISNECKCLWSNCNSDCSGFNNEGYKEVNNWMFVGFFVPREVIKKVGLPREDFFIYHDDTEYAERIIKNGFKIYKVEDSVIEHGDFSKREMLRKRFCGKYLEFPKMPDWKLYYYERNFLLKYSFKEKGKYTHMLYHIPKDIIKMCILDGKKCKIMITAYFDGILGKSGKKQF